MLSIGPPRPPRLIAVLLLCCFPHAKAWACPYAVRDVGYSSWNRGTYVVYLFAKDGSPESQHLIDTFDKLAKNVFADSNVEAEVVPAEKREAHDAAAHLEDLDASAFPALLLVSPDDRALRLCGVEIEGMSEEKLTAELRKVVSSPAVRDLEAHCITNWCIPLLVHGTDDDANAKAEERIETASDEVTGTKTAMGRTIVSGPHLVVVPANDPKERVILWSLQLDKPSEKPRVVVLYGRGQQIGPIFEGKGITREKLVMTFQALGRNCSCTADPSVWSGPSIPLCWSDAQREEVRSTYGFDPDSPRFRSMVAEYVPQSGASTNFMRGVIGYSEGYVEYVDRPPDAPTVAMPTVENLAPPDAEETSTLEHRTGHTLALAVGGMIALVLGVGGVLIARRMRVS